MNSFPYKKNHLKNELVIFAILGIECNFFFGYFEMQKCLEVKRKLLRCNIRYCLPNYHLWLQIIK